MSKGVLSLRREHPEKKLKSASVRGFMEVPLIDLPTQYKSIRGEIDEAISGVLDRGAFILGSEVQHLEQEIAHYLGVECAVGVGSGTDALLLSLRALGIGPGDEVIVPAFTFFATAEVVMLLGATPILVDVDPETYCLDVQQLEQRITPLTKAVIPVHLFGHPCDMDSISDIAQQKGLKVVEDNAQAIGAEYKSRKTGALGDAGCLSFYPTKNLGAYGDGGYGCNQRLLDRRANSHVANSRLGPEILLGTGWLQ